MPEDVPEPLTRLQCPEPVSEDESDTPKVKILTSHTIVFAPKSACTETLAFVTYVCRSSHCYCEK